MKLTLANKTKLVCKPKILIERYHASIKFKKEKTKRTTSRQRYIDAHCKLTLICVFVVS